MRSLLLAVVAGAALAGCASLPPPLPLERSAALTNTGDTRLGQAVSRRTASHPGLSGVYPLPNAREAFAARVLLAQTAERSLDLQYYIWHDDTTGRMLFDAVWKAAERGVRVRLLLDDANTAGLDPTIAVLAAHPNITVRLFNPFANREFRLGDAVTDFARVNRRMHNKSFTADGQVAIVGGRNVGDEYYGADSDIGFRDLDALVVGPVVREVADEFDAFWNSESAYPATTMVAPVSADAAGDLRAAWDAQHVQPAAARYVEAVRGTVLVRELVSGDLPLEWTTAHVVHDDPSKVLQSTDRTDLHLSPQLERALGKPAAELDLVSPYFVPGTEGTASLRELRARGVDVRVLTNSQAATDVAVVHAGYSRYRVELLQAGVRLYELKPDATGDASRDGATHSGISDSATSGLHAKTFAVDRSRIFVGSFNLDPRSDRLNTEMGVVIDSPILAGRLADEFRTDIPRDAYEVRLAADGRSLEWIDQTPGGEVRHGTEPQTTVANRLWIRFLSILPIEWLL